MNRTKIIEKGFIIRTNIFDILGSFFWMTNPIISGIMRPITKVPI